MGCSKKLLLGPSLLICLLAYALYVPVYDGYSKSRFNVRAFLTGVKISRYMTSVGGALGYDTDVNITRKLMALFKPTTNVRSVESTDHVFDGVSVRVYRPAGVQDRLPAVIYIHGGGWSYLSVEHYDATVIDLTAGVGAVFFSVDYRLTPEHPFPLPVTDCMNATLYILRNAAKEFNVDVDRVAIAGDSCGGTLAAAVVMKLRDYADITQPKLQILLYPTLQGFDLQLPSYQQNEHDPFLSRAMLAKAWAMYAEGNLDNIQIYLNNQHVPAEVMRHVREEYLNHSQIPDKMRYSPYEVPDEVTADERLWHKIGSVFMNPLFSPLIADDLTGLPSAYIVTAEHDVLRDDGFLYARRLQQAGVKVTHDHLYIGFHVVTQFAHLGIEEAGDMATTMYAQIKTLLFNN